MKRFLTFLLLLSFLPLASIAVPWVFSQSYTTFTTMVTTVNQLSFTNTFSTAVQSVTSTSSGQTTLVDTAYAITGTGQSFCMAEFLSFDAQQGKTVTGLISSNKPSTLQAYILTDNDFLKWSNVSTPYCDPRDNKVQVQWASPSAYLTNINVKWTPPADGKYWLIPESNYNSGVDLVTVNLASPSVQIITSVLFSTSVEASVFATTQTLTSVQVQPLSQTTSNVPASPLQGIPGFPFEAIVLGVGLGIALLVLSHRQQKRIHSDG